MDAFCSKQDCDTNYADGRQGDRNTSLVHRPPCCVTIKTRNNTGNQKPNKQWECWTLVQRPVSSTKVRPRNAREAAESCRNGVTFRLPNPLRLFGRDCGCQNPKVENFLSVYAAAFGNQKRMEMQRNARWCNFPTRVHGADTYSPHASFTSASKAETGRAVRS